MPSRDDIARLYGFRSYAELLDISEPLPMLPGDTVRSYVARSPKGHWFVWEDCQEAPMQKPPAVDPLTDEHEGSVPLSQGEG